MSPLSASRPHANKRECKTYPGGCVCVFKYIGERSWVVHANRHICVHLRSFADTFFLATYSACMFDAWRLQANG